MDGKQRLYACLAFLRGDVVAHFPRGGSVKYADLDDVDRRNLATNVTMDWNFVELDHAGVMDFYLRLNAGGTVHKDSELSRVRAMLEKERKEKRR